MARVLGRRAVLWDSNAAALKPWRAVVRAEAVKALDGRAGFEGAVYVLLDFYMPRPKTVSRLRPSVKPDIDKLTRAILDALTDSGVVKDDGQVVSLSVEKWYALDGPARVDVKVCELA